jgi:hypothetical protein
LVGLRLLKVIRQADAELAKEFLGKRYEPLVNLLGRVLRS